MTDRQDRGRPQGYAQQGQPRAQRWQPPQYDPAAHQRRIQDLRPDPWRQPAPWQPGYRQDDAPWQDPPRQDQPRQDQPRQQPYPSPQQVPWQPQPAARVHRKARRMRDLALLALAGGIAAGFIAGIAVAGGPSRPVAAMPTATPVAAQRTAATPGPLTLGHFPQTPDGRLARRICEAWSGLRQDYAARVAADSSYQLIQWLSGPAWHAARADGVKLGTDPAYSQIETTFAVATVGAAASTANARLLDQACEAAD